MGIFSDWARRYWDCDISIVPVHPKTKAAVVSYDLYREEKCSEQALEEWEIKYHDHNIGMVTGKASRQAVIDIDIKNNPELLSKALSLLPRSPVQKFGSKGLSIHVQYTNQTGGKIYYNGQEIGDMIVNTQVVIPPSIHPDTNKPYVWTGYKALGDENINDFIDELPIFNDSDLFEFQRKLEGEDIQVDKDFYKQILGRNDRLKKICGGMFKQGMLPEEVASRLLAEDLILNGDNALFLDSKEFKKLAKQPLACAYRFASSVFMTYLKAASNRGELVPQFDSAREQEIKNESDYFKYKEFFDKSFKSPKKCIISGDAVDAGDEHKPLVMRIEALQSYAKEDKLGKSDVVCHLSRYIEKLKPELLLTIPKWDGKDYVGELCQHVEVDGCKHEYFENYIKYWGSRVFARLHNSDNQNTFLILKGNQGLGKDRFVKNLVKGFGLYYSKFTVQPNKEIDTIHQVASNLVLHLEEFDQSQKLSVAFLKEIITCDEKTYRLPYDRSAMRRKMYASFISTVNVEDIFRDSTGNRRFAVFDLKSIDWKYSKEDHCQIVAQFKSLYESDYNLTIGSKNYMDKTIANMTPDDVTDELLELWDTRISALILKCKTTEFKMDDAQYVINDLKTQTGWSLKTVFSFLKRHKRSVKRGGSMLYVAGKRVDLT